MAFEAACCTGRPLLSLELACVPSLVLRAPDQQPATFCPAPRVTLALPGGGGALWRFQEGWTVDAVQALQVAIYQVDATHANYWQEVACRVPGKTAGARGRQGVCALGHLPGGMWVLFGNWHAVGVGGMRGDGRCLAAG